MSQALAGVGSLDSITISGDGEPTLHPHLGAVVAEVLGAVRNTHPEVPVRILSNGSGAVRPVERRALSCLDECILKLDAAPERVALPAEATSLEAIAEAYGHLDDLTLQACFVEGAVSNVEDEAVIPWLDLVAAIRPRAVQVYSIDRAGWVEGVGPAAPERLREIGEEVRRRTGAPVQVTER